MLADKPGKHISQTVFIGVSVNMNLQTFSIEISLRIQDLFLRSPTLGVSKPPSYINPTYHLPLAPMTPVVLGIIREEDLLALGGESKTMWTWLTWILEVNKRESIPVMSYLAVCWFQCSRYPRTDEDYTTMATQQWLW
jgi:hypothetical protein